MSQQLGPSPHANLLYQIHKLHAASKITEEQKAELKREVFRNEPELIGIASASWTRNNEFIFQNAIEGFISNKNKN